MKPQVTSQYWYLRAEQTRAMAARMSDPRAKQTMFNLADSYEHWAAQTAARARRDADPALADPPIEPPPRPRSHPR